jgi:transcriptional regulator with XRE-family HTH domain
MNMDTIGERVWWIMSEKRLRPTDLANQIGINKQYLYDIKASKIKHPSYPVLMKFKDVGINPDWLMTGEGEPFLDGYVEPEKKSFSSEINDRVLEELRLLRAQLQKKDEQIDKLLNLLGKPNVSQSIPPVSLFRFPYRAAYHR